MSGKGWQYRLHIQFTLTREYFFLQAYLVFQPFHRQRTVPTIYVSHPMPGQIRRSREVRAYFDVRHSHFRPDFMPHGFLSGNCQRHIYTIKGHPVNKALPFLPLPPRHRVTIRAVIQEKTSIHSRFRNHLLTNHRQFFRNFNGYIRIPRHCSETVIFQVMVQSHRH